MAKTEIILIHNVVGLGGESDQVKVSAGYARNYLIPGGLAIPLSHGNKRRIESLRQRRGEREAHELNTMTELGKSLSKVVLMLMVKTGDDGKMFGSVTSGTIADAMKTQLEVSLDKKKIHLERPIHTIGEHDVELRLHPDVKSSVKVLVKSSNLPAEKLATDDKAEAPRTEKRSTRHAAPKAEATDAKPARAPRADKK
ncbi:MAG: 50S ribosomal protein L9 [Pedosphaera sp.]|nr:50S ribosomal protein L9 [Pedosphaera sp.]